MKKPLQTKADPSQIFLQAHRFNEAYKTLTSGDALDNPGIEILGIPAAIVSALSCELFFKCLICIETGRLSRGHHLKHLYDSLTPETRRRVTELWNKTAGPIRQQMWKNDRDRNNRPPDQLISMDLPTALKVGNETFEKIRYPYEGGLEGFAFILTDLPLILSYVAIEMRPELKALHSRNQKQPTSPTR